MTTTTALRSINRTPRAGTLQDVARAAMFAVASGVFLAAPPALPWVLALVASTNAIHAAARAWMTRTRPPLVLLQMNGTTVSLVIAFALVTG